jgi:hypothetical protein
VLSVGQVLQQIATLLGQHEALSTLDGVAVEHEFSEPGVDTSVGLASGDAIDRQATHFQDFVSTLRQLLSPDIDLESSEGFSTTVQRHILEGQAAPAQRRFLEVFADG